MITRRGWTFLLVALGLYFFANQTQVGWLYVLSALMAGVWLAAALAARAQLGGLRWERRVNGSRAPAALELYAGDRLKVALDFENLGPLPAALVQGVETCPPAAPAERSQPFFIPYLAPRAAVRLLYQAVCARRGWFELPPVELISRAPFGLSEVRRRLPAEGGLLVFPAWRPLKRLPLFDRRPAPETMLANLGVGGEFVGVREYRPGDSPRHVHWRTTARAGRLIVKEFAEETQPGLTIALDLRRESVVGQGDDDSLELAIQAAASLARYADERGLPVSLATNSRAWPAPGGPLSWWGLMNYLARVQADGTGALADFLPGLTTTSFVAAVLPAPDPAAVEPLLRLRQQGLGVLAVLVETGYWKLEAGGAATLVEAQTLAEELRRGGVEVRIIGPGSDWEKQLEAA